jgi:hypothetical protein
MGQGLWPAVFASNTSFLNRGFSITFGVRRWFSALSRSCRSLLHSLDNPRAETRWEIGHYDETEIFPYENPSSRPRSADVRRANPHRRSLC